MSAYCDTLITATPAPQDEPARITVGEFAIPAVNIPRFEAKIAQVNKTAAKTGCPPVTVEQLGEFVQERWYTAYDIDGQPFEKKGKFTIIKVRVTGEEPKFAGWTLAATLEGTEAGTLVRGVPGVELPADYQHADPTLC